MESRRHLRFLAISVQMMPLVADEVSSLGREPVSPWIASKTRDRVGPTVLWVINGPSQHGWLAATPHLGLLDHTAHCQLEFLRDLQTSAVTCAPSVEHACPQASECGKHC